MSREGAVPTAVLVSGRGSNLQSLLDAAAAPDYPARIALVISNIPGVLALERAEKAGVPALVVNHKDFAGRAEFERALDSKLREAGIELICLAGFLRLLTPLFTETWRGRLLNIHPSLLPLFKGLHTHQQALAAGVKLHGCTIHFVTADLDGGPIIAQAAVPVIAEDDEDLLGARVLTAEHRLFPMTLRLVAEGKARLEGDRVWLDPGVAQAYGALINPAAP